ncbi:unnamed protein product, partial [Amoebophrya sp. A120]
LSDLTAPFRNKVFAPAVIKYPHALLIEARRPLRLKVYTADADVDALAKHEEPRDAKQILLERLLQSTVEIMQNHG